MRSYTLALLSKLTSDGRKIEDKDIIEWVNEKVSEQKCILTHNWDPCQTKLM